MREDHAAPRAAGGILRARTHGGSSQSLGIACEGGASDLIDFSVNVNPAGPSPRAVAAACKALSRIDAYPDRESRALVRALARAQGIPEDTIVCGAGASDIIWRLAAAVRPKRIVVCAPTFSEYAEAASYYGACVQEFPLSEADDFDVPASFARAIEGPGDVAYLCNPNNPTGRLVDPRVIDAAACRCEQVGALLVVDECFLGFAPDARERSVAARAACSRHVAVLSAFTKLYGMAGLRLGYLISGNTQLIEGIRRAGQVWPVSSVAEAAGIAALEDVEYVSRTRDVLAGERAWLSHELSSLGLSVVPSDANFLLVRTPAKDIPERLYKQGVLVRTCDSFSVLSRFWCRVAVRTRKENARLAMAFSRAAKFSGMRSRSCWEKTICPAWGRAKRPTSFSTAVKYATAGSACSVCSALCSICPMISCLVCSSAMRRCCSSAEAARARQAAISRVDLSWICASSARQLSCAWLRSSSASAWAQRSSSAASAFACASICPMIFSNPLISVSLPTAAYTLIAETARIEISRARIAYVSTMAGNSMALPNCSGFLATIPIPAAAVLP